MAIEKSGAPSGAASVTHITTRRAPEQASLPASPGRRDADPRGSRVTLQRPAAQDDFVTVARDMIEQAGDIARDSVALGVLEVRRVVDESKREVKDIVPRMIWGAGAASLAVVGAISLVVAAFIGAGAIIPSLALRFLLLALLCFGVAGFGAYRASKKGKHADIGGALRDAKRDLSDVRLEAKSGTKNAIAPIHPTQGVGE